MPQNKAKLKRPDSPYIVPGKTLGTGSLDATGEFLVLKDRGIVISANQGTATLEFLEQTPVVDVEAERLGSSIKIGAIDKHRDLAEGQLGHIMRDR